MLWESKSQNLSLASGKNKNRAYNLHFSYINRRFFRCLLLGTLLVTTGCATQSANQYLKPFIADKYKTIRIEPCIDRTGLAGTRDLGAEASYNLHEEISDSGLFAIRPNGELMLSCDIERFAEGSALKRWLWPGWGVTKAKVTVMVWEQATKTVLAVLSSVATVESGGLYTIGADRYIIGVTMTDIVEKLKLWSQGKTEQP